MTGRPMSQRRPYSVDELAALSGLDASTLERRLRGLGRRRASWCGSGWRLADPGWAALLGPEFVDVLALGSVRAYRELVEVVAVDWAVREPRGARQSRSARSLSRRERARVYAFGGADLRRVGSRWGEDVEVLS